MPGSFASFVVCDLRADPRFRNLPYVEKPPHFRFYAGVPLISAAGYRIGSLFVIDTRPGQLLSRPEVDFLGTMATNIMRYLEFQAEHHQQERRMVMSQGLAALVANDGQELPASHKTSSQADGTNGYEDVAVSAAVANREPDQKQMHGIDSEQYNNQAASQGSDLVDMLFKRAADLLRGSLDVEYAVFIDFDQDDKANPSSPRPARIRAVSSAQSWSIRGSPGFDLMADKMLLEAVCEGHPAGKLWCYNEDGHLTYEEEPAGTRPNIIATRLIHPSDHREATNVLPKRFPGAHQIAFVPLHDSGSLLHNTVCFVVKKDSLPLFSSDVEISFMRNFVNSLTVLHDRLSVQLRETQKTQFISSISHVSILQSSTTLLTG